MIDKQTVERIYNAAQIVDVVGDFITLRKRGVNFVGLCPFHADKSPSFYVSPSKNICKCFACGEGGTAVQFIMKHEQVSYNEALKWLAKKYGIEVKERELTDEEKRQSDDRESMMILNSWTQKFFSTRLLDHQEGRTIALPYFAERGFREDIIRKFQLGYSLERRDDLYKNAIKQGFKEEFLLKTGLVYRRDDGSVSDRFHGRVIFPVHTLSGKVVAFGGRIMKKNEKLAKYVNSPESEIYHKSYELYGIYFAKQAIMKADKCYLVEGYTDVISMHQSGIENVVASSGTALTSGQIRLIRRFTNNITVLYDGDAAGIKAALRGIDMLLEEGMNVKVVLLPEGEDPDSFARSHNTFDFSLFIKENETDFIRFKTDLLLKDAAGDPIKKVRLIRDIMESVAVIPDQIVRSVYIKECSQMLDVGEQNLTDEVRKLRENNRNKSRRQPEETAVKTPPEQPAETPEIKETPDTKEVKKTNPFKRYESHLVRYIIHYGERVLFSEQPVSVAEYILNELLEDDIHFETPLYRQVADEAAEKSSENDFSASHYFLTHTNLEISKLATDMLSSKYQVSKFFKNEDATADLTTLSEEDRQKEEIKKREKENKQLIQWIIHDILLLKNAYIKHQIDDINKQIKQVAEDEDKVFELLKQRQQFDQIKCLLSKELGERIVIGLGK